MSYMTVNLVRQNSYTKDYIGLASDTKPTKESGSLVEGVNNGDTFYEVDTGKKYIFLDGTWYVM